MCIYDTLHLTCGAETRRLIQECQSPEHCLTHVRSIKYLKEMCNLCIADVYGTGGNMAPPEGSTSSSSNSCGQSGFLQKWATSTKERVETVGGSSGDDAGEAGVSQGVAFSTSYDANQRSTDQSSFEGDSREEFGELFIALGKSSAAVKSGTLDDAGGIVETSEQNVQPTSDDLRS